MLGPLGSATGKQDTKPCESFLYTNIYNFIITQVNKYPNCHGAIDPVPCPSGSASGEMLTGGVVQFLQGRMGLQGEEGPVTHANHGERM